MKKQRPHIYNSSNLFHGVTRKKGRLISNQKFKNYYQKMSQVIGLTFTKSSNISLKENQTPYLNNNQKTIKQTHQQDLINYHQFNDKNFKIRSLKLKNATTIINHFPTSKRIKNFSFQLKQIKCSQQIIKMCHKISFKNSQQQLKEQSKWGIILDSQLFISPKIFWKEKSIHFDKRSINTQKHSRIKNDILDKFIQKIQNLTGLQKQIEFIFRVKSSDQMEQLQSYLKFTKHKYCKIFYIKKKLSQSLIFYNLKQLGNLPQNLIFLEQKHKNCLYLPFLPKNSTHKIVYLLIDSLLKHNGINLIDNVNEDKNQMSVNGILLFQQHLSKYGINDRIHISTCRIKRASKNSSKDKLNSYLISFEDNNSNNNNKSNYLQRLDQFKDKMVKYIKIMQQEKRNNCSLNQQLKSMIELNYNNIYCQSKDQSYINGCKTPNQVIAQLIKLNSLNYKQINGFYQSIKQIKQVQINRQQKQTIINKQKSKNISYQIPIFRVI